MTRNDSRTWSNVTPLLDIRHLSVSFDTDEGRLLAVDDVSWSIGRGQTLGLVGESGCGKTVTAMSILRLLPSPPGRIEAGQILFHDRNLLTLPIGELRRVRGNGISVIFQEPMTALSPLHRIGHQLVEALRFHRPMDGRTARAVAESWLTKVGIPDAAERMRAYPFQLSGGMRQRVMIAMALMMDPELIIADEPTTALDVTIQAQVFDLMRDMRAADTALLLITHDMGAVWEMCSHVAVMYASEIVETGPAEDLFGRPRHPYTQALLQSIPSRSKGRGPLPVIKGQVPSPLNYPLGCRFHDRCPYAFARCRGEHPPAYGESGRLARCFLCDPSSRTTADGRSGPSPVGEKP